jgi:hypothetical protein
MNAKQRKRSGADQSGGGDNVERDKIVQGDEVFGDKVMGDKITPGDVQGVGIAIGPGASVRIYGDVHYYPIKLRAPLRIAFNPLIEDCTKVFGGREADFTRIAEFIRNSAGGYLVLTAPAGFGKTALMANLVASTPQAFAYHFFTSLYGDSLSEDSFLCNVVEQMAQWHGHAQQLPDKRAELRALYQRFLAEPLEHTQVLVLDGLDEVTTWKLAPYVSRRLPQNLHFILTVRDVGQDWASDYSLPADQIVHLPLGGLTREDVAQVLRAAGNRAITFAEDAKLLEEVMRVSAYQADETLGADPFYVRLLAEDAAGGKLTPENIVGQPKGLNCYLDRWLQGVMALAGEAGESAVAVIDLLGTLVVALGPIGRADLESIHPSLQQGRLFSPFPKAVNRVRRFVKGDDVGGYTLMHSRFRDHMRFHPDVNTSYYQDKLLSYCANWLQHRGPYALSYYARHLAEAGERDKLYGLITKAWMDAKFKQTYSHRAFAEDVELSIKMAAADESPEGLVTLMRNCLIFATLISSATNVPPEILAILAQVGETHRALGYAVLIEDKSRQCDAYLRIAEVMINQGEREAARESLSKALAAAEGINNDKSTEKGHSLEALSQALAQLDDRNLISRAFAAAKALREDMARAQALSALSPALVRLKEPEQLRQALVAVEARFMFSAAPIEDTLGPVASALAQSGDRESLIQILVSAKRLRGGIHGANVLRALIPALAQIGDRVLLHQALAIAEEIKDKDYRWSLLCALARGFHDIEEHTIALDTAKKSLTAAERMSYDPSKIEALLAVAQGFYDIGQQEIAIETAKKALATAKAIRDNTSWGVRRKVEQLCAVALGLNRIGGQETAAEAAAEAFSAVEEIHGGVEIEWDKSAGICDAVEVLALAGDKTGLERALAASEAMKDEQARTFALSAVAKGFFAMGEKAQAVKLANSALAVAMGITREESKEFSISAAVVPALTQVWDREGLYRALMAVEQIQDLARKSGALRSVAQGLQSIGEREGAADAARKALTAAFRVEEGESKSSALSAAAQALLDVGERDRATEIAKKALVAAMGVHDEWQRGAALRAVAPALAGTGNQDGLRQSLAAIGALGDHWTHARHEALGAIALGLARVGDRDGISLARGAAEAVDTETDRAEALSAIVPALSQIGDQESLSRIFAIAEAFDGSESKAIALRSLAPALAQLGDRKGLHRALVAADAIKNDYYRAGALSVMVRGLIDIGESARAIEEEKKVMSAAKEVRNARGRAEALCDLGPALAQAEDLEVLYRTLDTAEAIRYDLDRAAVLRSLAPAFAHIRDHESLHRILAIAEAIPYGFPRAVVLGAVSRALAQLRDREGLLRSLAAAEATNFKESRAEALNTVAQGLNSIGERAKAAEAARKALAAAEVVEDESSRTALLGAVATVLWEMEDRTGALRVFRLALQTGHTLGRPTVFKALQAQARHIASLHDGNTLWQIYQAVQEVDSWWSAS